MSKRLRVILKGPENREVRRAVRSCHMSMAGWVRQALAVARWQQPGGDLSTKLEVVRAAAPMEFPIVEIHQMVAAIESGYQSGARS